MKKVIKNYGGLILLYMVIFFGIVALCNQINYLNEKNDVTFINKSEKKSK